MKTIRDPLWKNIELDDCCAKIVQTAEFNRLNDIKQLGPTFRVYPGATHTRFAHSIGVYHLANLLINNLIQKGADWITPEGKASFVIASLCHDLGHFPFTHALKELPLKDHEVLTGTAILNSGISEIIAQYGMNPEFVAAIVDKEIVSTDEQIVFFRKLLSGVLDPDKLDYLNRDAFYCGVPYGIQDTDYALASILPDRKHGIMLDSKSIAAVENLLFSKYLMYRTVYWHKDVRIATAMMKKSLYGALKENFIEPEKLYNLTDSDLINLIEEKSSKVEEREIWYPALQYLNGNIYKAVYEISFDSKNGNHTRLENLEFRYDAEKRLSKLMKCNESQVLIDIPEKISFESNLWISDENCEFAKSSTVFKENTVKAFTENLRIIRVAVDSKIEFDIKNINLEEIL